MRIVYTKGWSRSWRRGRVVDGMVREDWPWLRRLRVGMSVES